MAIAALVLLAVALYARSLDGPFVYDDPNGIVQSQLIRSITPLSRFAALSTRPLTDLSFALDYAAGQLDPRPFHVTNLLLHVLNGLLVYGLALRTLSLASLSPRYGERYRAIAWAAAALFVAHPLATETVAYVSSRSEVLVAFFYLLALNCYVTSATTQRRAARIGGGVALFVCSAAALASKEIAVTIPLALFLYDWCFLAGGGWRRVLPRWHLIGLAMVPLAAGGALLIYRAYTAKVSFGSYAATAGFSFDRFSQGQYIATQFGVILHYLRLVVLPVGLTFDYDWPLASSLWAPQVLTAFGLLVVLAFLALRGVSTQPLFAFAILWLFVALAPTSSLMPLADLAVERRMYIPLIGLMLLAAASAWDLVNWLCRPRAGSARIELAVFAVLIAIPLGALSALTASRAALWGDAVALHQDGVAKAPRNPRVRLNLGVTYLNGGARDAAYAELREAKRLYELHESVNAFQRIGAFIHYNLGAVLYLKGEHEQATADLLRALELGGQYLALRPMALFLLARIAAHQGDWPNAAARYEAAIRINQDNADWWVGLAQAQWKSGRLNKARQTLRRALHRFPGNPKAKALLHQLPPPPAGKRRQADSEPG